MLIVMPSVFIVTEQGMPYVAEELKAYEPNRLSAMRASWSQCKAFDGISRYQPQPETIPSFSAWQRLLARTVYNPRSGVRAEWRITGECSLAEIISEVEKGLEKDDDIIQQWFEAADVLELVRSATTFEEMVDRVRCVCGEFEIDARLQKIIDDVLGPIEA